MRNEVNCLWTGDMAFDAEVGGHTVRMDAGEADGGRDGGARPKPLVLAALGGCTGMDVVSLLRKMRQPLTWFNVKVEADGADEHPKRYTKFKVVYQFKASDGLDDGKVRKAVELSQDGYCGVSATLRPAGPVDWEIAYL
jgi:putative redox protein